MSLKTPILNHGSTTIGEIYSDGLGANFLIKLGIEDKLIKDLIDLSNTDEEIQKNTRDKNRFGNMKNFLLWKKKERQIYTLINTGDKLQGLIWFGVETIPEKIPNLEKYPFTFGIRLYPPARGKGLSKKFIGICLADFKNSQMFKDSPGGIWLTTQNNNLNAQKVYLDCGFKKAVVKNDQTVMTLD